MCLYFLLCKLSLGNLSRVGSTEEAALGVEGEREGQASRALGFLLSKCSGNPLR